MELPPAHKVSQEEIHPILSVPARLKRTGMEMKMILDGENGKSNPDSSLVRLIVKAHTVKTSLPSCSGMEFGELAKHHRVGDSYISRLFRLTSPCPRHHERQFIEGRQPPELTGAQLMRDTRFPLEIGKSSAAFWDLFNQAPKETRIKRASLASSSLPSSSTSPATPSHTHRYNGSIRSRAALPKRAKEIFG